MCAFAGAFGDPRRAEAMSRLYGSIVDLSSVVVRKVGVDRAGEISAHRALSSPWVTPAETLGCLARATARAVAGRRIVVAQDTTEVNFAGRQSRGLGPAGQRDTRRGDPAPGFFIHAAVAVDAQTDAVLGLAHAEIWTRDPAPPPARRERALADKESQRWLSAAQIASERLSAAAQVIVVGDRESDIYALFSRLGWDWWCARGRTGCWTTARGCLRPPLAGLCWGCGRSRSRRAAPETADGWQWSC